MLTCLCFVSLQLYLQRLKRTSDKLNCEKSLWEGTDQCKIPTKGWEQDDYMHIRPKSSFSHCRAGDCSELSHMLVLFIYLDLFFFTCFLFFKMYILMSCCCGTVYCSHLPLFWDTFHHYPHPPHIDNYDQMSLPGSPDGDCPSCLKDNIRKCRNLFCPAEFCQHECDRQVRYGDRVCSCWFLPLVPLLYEKTFRWSWTRLADSLLSAP